MAFDPSSLPPLYLHVLPLPSSMALFHSGSPSACLCAPPPPCPSATPTTHPPSSLRPVGTFPPMLRQAALSLRRTGLQFCPSRLFEVCGLLGGTCGHCPESLTLSPSQFLHYLASEVVARKADAASQRDAPPGPPDTTFFSLYHDLF